MAPDAFPRDAHAAYKRATSFFLQWLLRVHNGGVGAATDMKHHPLDFYERAVHTIAQDPTSLAPSLLQLLPRALEACESAITLRKRVARFLAEAADEAHAHFLRRLKTWFKTLKTAYTPSATQVNSTPARDTKDETTPLDFSNYYAVLSLPDDYFADDTVDVPAPSSSTVPALSKAEQKRLLDEAFAQDLNAELASLFMELEELSEGVYAAFHDVKLEKATLLEATAVAKVAIDSAASVIARLQLRYPSIRNAEDLAALIRDRLTLMELNRLVSRISAAWHHDGGEDENNVKYRYVPGTVLLDVLWLEPCVVSFGNQIRARPGQADAKVHGEKYSKEDTPLYSEPMIKTGAMFISQQLPSFHQFMVEAIKNNLVHTEFAAIWLLDLFEDFSTTGTVTIQLLFVCICWFRSVAALEGNRGLGRTISLSITHRWELHDRLNQSIQQADAHYIDQPSREKWWELLDEIRLVDDYSGLLRLNPLLAGCFLMYHQVKYLSTGHEAMIMNSRFKAFGHIYVALRDRQLLDEIPFVEDTLQVYEHVLFASPRAEVTHGRFARSFLLSKRQVEASVNASPSRGSRISDATTPAWLRIRLEHFSHVYNVLFAHDYSALQTDASANVSWTRLLQAVSALVKREIFGSRVLSRDILKLNDDLTDLFFSLRDELCRQAQYERMLEGPYRSQVQAVSTALESCVVFPLLPLLDALALDGTVGITPDISGLDEFRRTRMQSVSDASDVVGRYCRHVAQVIARKFGGLQTRIEKLYFTLPPMPAWATLQFGSAYSQSSGSILVSSMATPETFDESRRSEAKVLDALMGMLKASRGPLRSEQLAKFKRDIIAHPGILSMASTDKSDELCTLLHHAAAGPAHDRRLVEWLIQMGALAMEPPHCRLANIMPQLDSFSNMLAVHCAAKKGFTEIVKLILHGGNMRDLDTPTYRTKESLVHIAVKTDNRKLFDWLTAMGADVSGKDASGKRVWNLTTDPSFKAHIMYVNDFQSKQKNRMKARMERGHGIYEGGGADELMQSLRAEATGTTSRPETSAVVPVSASALSTPGGSSKNNKKKKKNKKNKTAAREANEDSDVATATSSIQELPVSTASEVLDDNVVQLEDALNKVKQGASVSRQQREASAAIALRIISEIEAVVQRAPMLRRVSSTASLDRELLSAARAVFLLDAYHQQLPTQDPTSSTHEPTNVDKLNAKAGSNDNVDTFYLFMMFACAIAMSLHVCGHKSRAEDVFQLIERRLLAIQYRGETFRRVIEDYVGIRKMAKISPALGSTHDAQTHFKWYASNQGIDNKALLETLDCLHGARFYVCMFVHGGWNTSAAVRCTQLINSSFRHGRGVVYLDEFAFTGTDTTDQVADFVRTVTRAAQASGLRVNMQSSVIGATELPLFNFVFSATGILPNDHSNCRYCTH